MRIHLNCIIVALFSHYYNKKDNLDIYPYGTSKSISSYLHEIYTIYHGTLQKDKETKKERDRKRGSVTQDLKTCHWNFNFLCSNLFIFSYALLLFLHLQVYFLFISIYDYIAKNAIKTHILFPI